MSGEINKEISKAEKILLDNNIEDARLKAEYVFEDIFSIKLNSLNSSFVLEGKSSKLSEYFSAIEKVSKNIPYQYATKKAEFLGNILKVTEDVLIPRLDSEILVSEVLKAIYDLSFNKGEGEYINIMEVGVGSGALLLSIFKELDKRKIRARLVGTDLSISALKVASENLRELDSEYVEIYLVNSDIFNASFHEVFSNYGQLDIMYSNPPYLSSNEMKELPLDVRNEPKLALYGGESGLEYYIEMIKQAKEYDSFKYILFEIGFKQALEISKYLDKYNFKYEIIKDMENRDRVIKIYKEK